MSRSKKNIVRIATLLSFLILFFSCENRKKTYDIELPSTPILTSQQQWAVIKTNYARLFSEKKEDSSILVSLRKGDIVSIISIEVGNNEDYWYYIEEDKYKGWLETDCIDLYDSRSQALLASESMINQ